MELTPQESALQQQIEADQKEETPKIDPKDLEIHAILWRVGQPLKIDQHHYVVHALNRKGNRMTLKTISKHDYDKRKLKGD